MGDGQQAQVCVTSRSKPRGLEVLGVAGGALQLPVGRVALASRSVGDRGPQCWAWWDGSCPLVSRCKRGSQPPPLLSAERSAGSDAAGELSDAGHFFFFFFFLRLSVQTQN